MFPIIAKDAGIRNGMASIYYEIDVLSIIKYVGG